MSRRSRLPASHSSRPLISRSTTDSTLYEYVDSGSLPAGQRQSVSRAGSRPSTRSRRAGSTLGGGESQQIICAVSEARGVSPTVGLAFVNISTGEAVLSQICDNQFYVRTCHKIQVFEPTEILIVSTSAPPNPTSKMYNILEEEILGSRITPVDRRYWSETAGLDYIQQLAFCEDVEAIKVAIGGNYFATCCLAAALKYIDLGMSLTFAYHSLRIKYQPSEDSMMIDLSTILSLELIQNIQIAKSKDCLFGLLNETLTPMGARLLRSSILQPSTLESVLSLRYDALDELALKEEMFFATRQALKSFLDVDKLLTNLILRPKVPDIQYAEQSINNVLVLKSFVQAVGPLHEAVAGARSRLLVEIKDLCKPERVRPTIEMICSVINDDVSYQKSPLDLRNQRTYAVKSGLNGLLDVARVTFKEATEDVHQHVAELNQRYDIQAETRYENARRYYLRISESEFQDRAVPDVLINRFRRKGFTECQTLDLVKLNQRIQDSHQEVVLMSDKTISKLLEDVRAEIPALYRVCESIAMLDMLASFAKLVTMHEYVRPEITNSLAIKAGRHPVHEKVTPSNRSKLPHAEKFPLQAHAEKHIPNDVYATEQTRFQVITGCNMSGKSTYIRSIALMTVMAQVGSFVPASYASFPLRHQLFARVSMDDCIEANVSTFASEMRETAFILRNIDAKSLAIIDELGRGTSTRDGLAIAISIAEALVDSKAFVWFATHFRELAQIMNDRLGVINMHLKVDMSEPNKMVMIYKLARGFVQEDHYGLALARAVELPPPVLDIAARVSGSLEVQAAAKMQSSKARALAKRRKLVLGLKEQLMQARDSPMEGNVLLSWLRRLQEAFVERMEQITNDAICGEQEEEMVAEDPSEIAEEVANLEAEV